METQYVNQVRDFFLNFTSILYEAMPWVVLGAVLAGIVQEIPWRRAPAVMLAISAVIVSLFVSQYPMLWTIGPAVVLGVIVLFIGLKLQPLVDYMMEFLGDRRYLSIMLCGLLGLVIPMCECGIIPLTRRLLRKGLPMSCCVTFILAGPIINVVVLMTTYVAFAARQDQGTPNPEQAIQMTGLWMLGLRALLGFITAVVVGFIVEPMSKKYGTSLLTGIVASKQTTGGDEEDVEKTNVPLTKRIGNITETALHDFVDISVFLIIGALIASAAKIAIQPKDIEEMSKDHPSLAIIIMMVFAVCVTLCSEADAFVAANFVTLRPAAKLAFLVLGPMLDFKLILMYTRIFRHRLMWTIITCVVVQVFVYSYITHILWEQYGPRPDVSSKPVPTLISK